MDNQFVDSKGNYFVHSCYYCPNCGKHDEEGDLYVKEVDPHNPYAYIYYCTKCKKTFRILPVLSK